MALSFQLYSARFEPSIADFLPTLAGLGYSSVEGFPDVYDDAEFRDALNATGLTMPTGHFPLEWVRDDPDRVLRIADALGIKTIFVPAVENQKRDAAGWRALGAELARAGAPFWAAGKSFGWHNHAFEFAPLHSDEMPLDLILGGDARLALELDIAWVQVAGQNPAAWIDRYADRIVAVHVKDIAVPGECEDEDGWADVGHGVLPWPELTSQLQRQAPGARLVAEHDRPLDVRRFAKRSIKALKAMR